MTRSIFVFGSNLAGIHGAGSARKAKEKYGAIQFQGEGLQGDSYAIPTKDERLKTLSLTDIEHYVNRFIKFAELHNDWTFRCVAIGCGLAGYKPEQVAPFFRYCPENVHLPTDFIKVLNRIEREERTKDNLRAKTGRSKVQTDSPGTVTRNQGRKR